MKTSRTFTVLGIALASCILLACSLTNLVSGIISPGAEIQPTSTPIPGWNKFEGNGIEIWLPGSFLGGDLSQDLDVILANLRNLGPDFAGIVQLIEANPEMFLIFATDSEVGPSGVLTNVNVTTEQVLSSLELDTYLDLATGQFPPQFQVTDRKIVSLGEYQAGRLEIEFQVGGIAGKELLYVIKDGTSIWNITYATGAAEFAGRLRDFELSALTFRKVR